MSCQRRLEKDSNTLLDFCFDLRMELPYPSSGFRSIPRTMRLHDSPRPNTASCETHLPASACFRDRFSDCNDLESPSISMVSIKPSN